jgi:16S rRNA processing protein RimM
MVLVGRIARTHGRRGHVIVNAETDFPEARFAVGQTLWLEQGGSVRPVTVAAMRMHQGRPVIAIAGVESMTDAEALAGLELRVPEASLAALEPGTYYEHDLRGCRVETVDGRVLGDIRALEGGGGATRLVIGTGRGEIQIPFVHEFCPVIDTAARRIVVDLPEGLIDVNA